MQINVKGTTLTRKGQVKPAEQLLEIMRAEGRKIKLTLPFQADGFVSEKKPLQPDGSTPIVVDKAGLAGNTKVEKVETKVEVKPEPKVKVVKKTKR